ncbi:MAG: DNA polymerase III subunit chi [Sphingomicrobium sp.]
MRVDFYQLGEQPAEAVIASIAARVVAADQRLLIVSGDEAQLARLDRLLWTEGADGFLPHGLAGGVDDARQPVLLSTSEDAPNVARNMLIVDGEWRESALSFDRAFYLFGGDVVEGARLAWKLLSGREGVDRRYWANESGKWVHKA